MIKLIITYHEYRFESYVSFLSANENSANHQNRKPSLSLSLFSSLTELGFHLHRFYGRVRVSTRFRNRYPTRPPNSLRQGFPTQIAQSKLLFLFFFSISKPCVLCLLLINPFSIYNLTIFALPFDSFVRVLFFRHFLVFWKYFFLAFESNFVLVLIKRYSIFCLLLINRVSICNVTIFALPFGLFVFVRIFFFRHFLVF